MAGKRYFAAAGIRHREAGSDWPFIVIFGPSGQAVQVPYPKGYINDTQFTPLINERIPTNSATDGSNNFGAGFADGLAAYEMTYSHVALAWFKNHIATSFIDVASDGRNIGYAFQPYKQPASGNYKYHPNVPLLSNDGQHRPQINSNEDAGGNGNFDPFSNIDQQSRVMADGFWWTQPFLYNANGFRSQFGFYRMPGGGMFWSYKVNEAETYQYGLWQAKFPLLKFVSELSSVSPNIAEQGSGWIGDQGINEPNFIAAPTFNGHFGGSPGGVDNYVGCKIGGNQQMTNLSTNVHDMVFHKGHMWITTQYNLFCVSPGGTMQMIEDERATENHAGGINDKTTPANIDNYTARREGDAFGGPSSRSLVSYNGDLYMLNNKGKFFLVRPGGIREIADLTEMGTFAASGIFGGALGNNPISASAWAGSSFYRCKVVSFGGQLHAFLNFTSTFNVAKAENADSPGTGRGIVWATSTDGVEWFDRSSLLPGSGINPPSGGLTSWLGRISPYRFSGSPGKVFPSGSLLDGNNTLDYPDQAGMAGPSGFNQQGTLDFWASGVGALDTFDVNVGTSGVILDDAGTPYNLLRVPLNFDRRNRELYPTFVTYPADYGFINQASGRVAGVPLASGSGGIYAPSGVGASGWDYTGCRNYHVSAFVDEIDNTLKVCFTEDFADGGALIYELNTASGWRLINHVRDCRQLNGLVPIDLYDPEVVISSGTQAKPNPSHDPVARTVTIDYEVFDWPFWRNIDVEVQYSIDDGQTWEDIGTIKNISTGSFATDPSGVLGTQHSYVWKYTDTTRPRPLSQSVLYDNVQVRMRGKDTTFQNPV